MTARKSDSTAKQSKDRLDRMKARRIVEKKLGRKLKKGEQVDHVKPKIGGSYDNGSSNLKAVSKTAHKKKMKNSKTETGGRPKGSKDTVKRKKRSK